MRNEQDTTREDQESIPESTTLLGQCHKVKCMTQKMQESQEQQLKNIVVYIIEEEIDYYLNHNRNEYNEQDKMYDLIAYKASTNPDI